jgi:hypothetical protein
MRDTETASDLGHRTTAEDELNGILLSRLLKKFGI